MAAPRRHQAVDRLGVLVQVHGVVVPVEPLGAVEQQVLRAGALQGVGHVPGGAVQVAVELRHVDVPETARWAPPPASR